MPGPERARPALFGQPADTIVLGLTLAAAALFVAFPALDLAAASWFHRGGNAFTLRDTVVHQFVDQTLRPGLKIAVLFMAAMACLSLATRGRMIGWPPGAIAYVGATFALGPGLLVNGVLKTVIGRARPKQIEAFGGDRLFSAAFEPAGQCTSNCSFVSGDVAFFAAALSFALMLRGGRRRLAVLAVIGVTGLAAFYRMATGAHFLSDVVLAALFCFLIALVLYRLAAAMGRV